MLFCTTQAFNALKQVVYLSNKTKVDGRSKQLCEGEQVDTIEITRPPPTKLRDRPRYTIVTTRPWPKCSERFKTVP